MKLLIHNARIVNEGRIFQGYVLIDNEMIADVVEGTVCGDVSADETIDAHEAYLLPGAIDDHVHFRDPGLTHKADMHTESVAARAGGVTSIMDMPNCKPATTSLEALDDKFAEAGRKCVVNYSFYFGATNDNVSLLPRLDVHRVCGVKVFMGSSTGNMLVDDQQTLADIFRLSPLLIAAHCEDQQIISQNTARLTAQCGTGLDVGYHPLIRSREACVASSRQAVGLARQSGARLHLLHVTTAEELLLLGGNVTGEATVGHLLFSEADYATLGSRIKCNPAIKTTADREALRQAVVDGTLNVIGTDHAPHLLSEKEGGALRAASGMPMIQFSLVSMIDLFGPVIAVQRMCHAPAELFRIQKRGYIRKGYYADLAIVRPEEWTLSRDDVLSKCKWSPLEGHRFGHKVVRTFINGISEKAMPIVFN
ncbi:MAG: dihydroorotase [Bacteroidales bacterium]|nr:dihydroorotase [Bacteroidales bacterium]